jgi:hypothetical protein
VPSCVEPQVHTQVHELAQIRTVTLLACHFLL